MNFYNIILSLFNLKWFIIILLIIILLCFLVMIIVSFYKIILYFLNFRWFIIALITIILLFLLTWIIIGYYIFKWFNISLNNYNFYLNKYNNNCINILKKYGNLPIKNIYLVRYPITKFIVTCLNLVTFYKFDKMLKKDNNNKYKFKFYPYHTMLYIELKISKKKTKFLLLEKNNCIKISEKIKILDNYEFYDISIKKNKYNLYYILDTTQKRIGNNKFFNWDIFKNNCQLLIKEILITLKKLTKKNKKFIYQKNFINQLKITDFSIYIIRILVNSVNFLENILKISTIFEFL